MAQKKKKSLLVSAKPLSSISYSNFREITPNFSQIFALKINFLIRFNFSLTMGMISGMISYTIVFS